MNKKQGSLTIEASIALTVFVFIVVTVLSFMTVYRAQNLVSHATLQTSQSLAIESYFRETVSQSSSAQSLSLLIKFAEILGIYNFSGIDDGYASLGAEGTDFYKIVKKEFAYSIADDNDSADRILKAAGIKNGLRGIDFSYSSVTGGDIIVNVQYEVKLPFSFFGDRTVPLSKSAKTKAFKKIKDNNGYQEPQESE